MGSCVISKNAETLDLIKMIQVYFKIYDLWRLPTYGCMDVLVSGWMGWVMSNHKK